MRIVEICDRHRWDEAVGTVDGPALVIGGPGTGKTEFLARRAAHLLGSGASGAVVTLTFSRRAAAELERRVSVHLPRPDATARAYTFPALAYRLLETLRNNTPVPRLLTAPQQVSLVAELLTSEDPAKWPPSLRAALTSPALAAEVADFLLRCQERLVGPDELAESVGDRHWWRALPHFLTRYRERLDRDNLTDYASVVARVLELVESGALCPPYRFVLVDHFGDLTPAQSRLAMALAGPELELTAAVDPHQSIFSFRGTDPDVLASFPERVAAAGRLLTVFHLRPSFRVTSPLLCAARRLVADNPTPRFDPVVDPAPGPGTIEGYTFRDHTAEADWISAEVERLHLAEEVPLSSMAVLMRSTRRLLPELSRALSRRSIPHNRPYRHQGAIPIVEDLMEAATGEDPLAVDAAVRRLLAGPLVGLPVSRIRRLERRRLAGESWAAILAEEAPEAGGLALLIDDSRWASELPASDGLWHVWETLPGIERLVHDPQAGDFRRSWATLSTILARRAETHPEETLSEASIEVGEITEAPRLSHRGEEGDRLVVTTIHEAIGLEFDMVFIADAAEGSFPDLGRGRRLLEPLLLAGRPAMLEEERRLAYTAVTRARRRVVWTATTSGRHQEDLRPSRFLLSALARFPGPPSPAADSPPLTRSALAANLHRDLLDPAAPIPRRLAALALLAEGRGSRRLAGAAERGPDRPLGRGELVMSATAAESYASCPRRFALERRLGARGGDSLYARLGMILHVVLERVERAACADGRPHARIDEALTELDRVWEEHPTWGPPTFEEAWRQRGRRFLTSLYAAWPTDGGEVVALEHPFRLELGGTAWVGRIDRVEATDRGLRLIEYKTGKNPPPQREVAGSLQMGIYALAAAADSELARHGPVVEAEMWFPLAPRLRHSFSLAELDSVKERLVSIAADVAAERWEPAPGRQCQRCHFRLVCPAWPEGRLEAE